MGSRILITALASAGVFAFVNFSAAKDFPIHAKEPIPEIAISTGIGTSDSKIIAKITKKSNSDWCDNWRPDDTTCEADMSEFVGKEFTATADCDAGLMTTPHGEKVEWAGFNSDDDFYNYYQFKNFETRKKIGFSNADGGVGLMAQWMKLCPYGLPYSVLPMTDTLNVDDEKLNSLRLDPDGYTKDYAYHNGKHMIIDYDLGTITYFEKQSATIPQNRILFRGSISKELGLPSRGMAYVFKKGCEAQPYYVEGYFDVNTGELALEGDAPVWDGCKISGYSSKSKNAKLVFNVMME